MDANPSYLVIITGTIALAVAGVAIAIYITYSTRRALADKERKIRILQDKEKLEESLHLTQFSIDNMSDAAAWIGPNGRLVQVNETVSRRLGYTKQQLLSMTVPDLDPNFSNDRWQSHWEELKRHHSIIFESIHRASNGETFPVEISSNYVEFGGKEYNCSFARDLTNRKKAEEEIKKGELKYKSLVDEAGLGVATADLRGRFTYVNKALCQMMGYSKEELIGKRFATFLHPEDKRRILNIFLSSWKDPFQSIEIHFRVLHRDGDVLYLYSKPTLTLFEDRIIGFNAIIADLTERKRAEKALRASEEKFRLLFEHVPIGVFQRTPGGRLFTANPALVDMFGYDSEDDMRSINTTRELYVNPEDQDTTARELESTGELKNVELILKRKDGTHITVLENAYAVRSADGKTKYYEGTLIDITERKRAQEALSNSEERFRRLSEASFEGIILHDKGIIIDINQAFGSIFGYDAQELIGKNVLEFATPELKEEALHHIQTESEKSYEGMAIRKDGITFPVEIQSRNVPHNGKTIRVTAVRDITVRKRAEEALLESEEKYRTTFESTGTATAIIEEDTTFNLVNSQFEKLCGYSKKEIEGKKSWTEFVVEDDLERMKEYHFQRRIANGAAPRNYEFRFKDRYGEVKNIYITVAMIPGSKKSITSLLDITERKQAEESLRESEEKYRQLFATVVDTIVIYDAQTWQFIDVNQRAVDLYGYTREEFLQMIELDISAEPEASELSIKETLAGYIKRALLQYHKKKDGTVFPAEISRSVYTFGERKVVCSVIRDITERKRTEENLKESHKQLRSLSAHLQSVREESQKLLAREIHDELGQDLTALKMDVSWLKGKLRQDQKILREKTTNMTNLADAMIQTVKRITARLRPVLLDDLGVAAALEWEAGEFTKRTGIGCELAVEPKELNLDSDRSTVVYRIFQEALTNIARHAQATSVEAALRVGSGRLEMEISDNGAGITEEQIASPRSFGLIGIRERVLQFGGKVTIAGRKGKGTTLAVTIPLDNEGGYND